MKRTSPQSKETGGKGIVWLWEQIEAVSRAILAGRRTSKKCWIEEEHEIKSKCWRQTQTDSEGERQQQVWECREPEAESPGKHFFNFIFLFIWKVRDRDRSSTPGCLPECPQQPRLTNSTSFSFKDVGCQPSPLFTWRTMDRSANSPQMVPWYPQSHITIQHWYLLNSSPRLPQTICSREIQMQSLSAGTWKAGDDKFLSMAAEVSKSTIYPSSNAFQAQYPASYFTWKAFPSMLTSS